MSYSLWKHEFQSLDFDVLRLKMIQCSLSRAFFKFKHLPCLVMIDSFARVSHLVLSLTILFIKCAPLTPRELGSIDKGVDPWRVMGQAPSPPIIFYFFSLFSFFLFSTFFISIFILIFPLLFLFWFNYFQNKPSLFFSLLFYYTFVLFYLGFFYGLFMFWIMVDNEVY